MHLHYQLIWEQMAGFRLRYGAAILALVVSSCFLYLVPLIPQVVLDGVLPDDTSEVSGVVRFMVELMGGKAWLQENLWFPALVVVLLSVIAGLFTYLRGHLAAIASESIVQRLRDRLYWRLQHLPLNWHDQQKTGDLVQRCTSDVETFRQFLETQVVEIGRAVIMLVVPIPLMLALDLRMTLVSLIVIAPIVLFSFFYFKRVQKIFAEVDAAEGELTSNLQENLTGIRVVRAFAQQGYEIDKFSRQNGHYRQLDYTLFKLFAWFWSVSDFLCMGQKVLVVGAGGYWLFIGELQVGVFYFFLTAVNMFIWPIRMMGRILSDLGKAIVAMGRIGDILGAETEQDPEQPLHFAPTPEGSDKALADGAIRFSGVSFRYPETSAALERVSFSVKPGETLAILGPSGSGKSTLVNLLLRFYDPQEGVIRIDGIDISRLSRSEVRRNISVVMQDPFLYSKSLSDNINLGRHEAVQSEIEEAATVACVHDAILEFDQGYSTQVGERGVTLSGGQRQRVALARALLRKPRLLILDDALSAVDTRTEGMILEAIEERKGRHTTLIIAHRLSTLMQADRVLVLEQGAISQQGTHETLVSEEGLYRRLWEIQSNLSDDMLQSLQPGVSGVPVPEAT